MGSGRGALLRCCTKLSPAALNYPPSVGSKAAHESSHQGCRLCTGLPGPATPSVTELLALTRRLEASGGQGLLGRLSAYSTAHPHSSYLDALAHLLSAAQPLLPMPALCTRLLPHKRRRVRTEPSPPAKRVAPTSAQPPTSSGRTAEGEAGDQLVIVPAHRCTVMIESTVCRTG